MACLAVSLQEICVCVWGGKVKVNSRTDHTWEIRLGEKKQEYMSIHRRWGGGQVGRPGRCIFNGLVCSGGIFRLWLRDFFFQSCCSDCRDVADAFLFLSLYSQTHNRHPAPQSSQDLPGLLCPTDHTLSSAVTSLKDRTVHIHIPTPALSLEK